MNLYWGDLRGYSKLSDGRRSPGEHYEYARDTAKLDFCALTDQVDHVPAARQALMVETGWQELQAAAKTFNEPGRFVTLLACERSVPSWDNEGIWGTLGGEGDDAAAEEKPAGGGGA